MILSSPEALLKWGKFNANRVSNNADDGVPAVSACVVDGKSSLYVTARCADGADYSLMCPSIAEKEVLM